MKEHCMKKIRLRYLIKRFQRESIFLKVYFNKEILIGNFIILTGKWGEKYVIILMKINIFRINYSYKLLFS